MIGRIFRPEEFLPGKGDAIVISNSLWQRSFNTLITSCTTRFSNKPVATRISDEGNSIRELMLA
jgi:hypothetical protein